MKFPIKRKPKISREAEFAGDLRAALLADRCKHGADGFCGRCAFEEQPDYANAPEGCPHGVTVDSCLQCAIDEGLIAPEQGLVELLAVEAAKPKPKGKLPDKRLRREIEQQLAGLPRMDTRLAAIENPRPFALARCPVTGGHLWELPRKYAGSMARGHLWWPGQKPPTDKCKLCGWWWDGSLERVGITISPEHKAAKHTGGWSR
jgi:hypothetical protein